MARTKHTGAGKPHPRFGRKGNVHNEKMGRKKHVFHSGTRARMIVNRVEKRYERHALFRRTHIKALIKQALVYSGHCMRISSDCVDRVHAWTEAELQKIVANALGDVVHRTRRSVKTESLFRAVMNWHKSRPQDGLAYMSAHCPNELSYIEERGELGHMMNTMRNFIPLYPNAPRIGPSAPHSEASNKSPHTSSSSASAPKPT